MMPETPQGLRDFEVLHDLAQLRALAHKDRIEILRELAREPQTGAMVAERLKLPPNRVHYHLQQLEKQGLVLLHKLGRKRWNEERYLTASARHYLVDPALAVHDPATTLALARSFEQAFTEWRRRDVLEIDFDSFARRIVNDSLRVRRHENVLVMFMPDGRELAEALAVELEAIGARPRLKFWSGTLVQRTLERHSKADLEHFEFMPADELESLQAGVFLSTIMPQGARPTDEQLAKLPLLMESVSRWHKELRRRSVRYLEVALPQRGEFEAGHLPVERAIDVTWRCLTAEPNELSRLTHEFVGRLPADRHLVLEDDQGRRLTLEVDLEHPLISDGVISDEDVAAGRTFDELPAGCVALLPRRGTANGRVAVDYTCSRGRHSWNLELVVRDGRLCELIELAPDDVGTPASELMQRIGSEAGDSDVLAAIRFGLNPEGAGITGKPVLDACFAGIVCLSVGNNEVLGGDVRSTLDLHFPCSAVTASLGGVTLSTPA